jgi:hypothetical protein
LLRERVRYLRSWKMWEKNSKQYGIPVYVMLL